jgi:superfamily II DNA or RNA helicase
MPNLVDVTYKQTGKSIKLNEYGMREMQAKAYEKRDSKYLLIKAPPASGKSRALMFIGLDKLANQDIKKVIVAVPERSIGSSFATTKLSENGFFTDWEIDNKYNLCTPGGDASVSKVTKFTSFLEYDKNATILVCTHATLRFAFEGVEESSFDNVLIAIDEFHHVSADEGSKLGTVLRAIMTKSSAQVIAMTGSYFRGDTVPVLTPQEEAKFEKVTYNYYEQLNGYTHLKSLGIGYHFYRGRYTGKYHNEKTGAEVSAVAEVLDTDKKTIIHIPSVQSGESTKEKRDEVNDIIDTIGDVVEQDKKTGIISVKRSDGKIIRVADLVEDTPAERDKIITYLRSITKPEDVDIIIALGMAKEGFDWPYCEHALTVGYRGSLTEIIQIIGRATRDSEGKTHAQFTNLIAEPDASDDLVKLSVNNMLKAITASLLMEQVLAPNFKFRVRRDEDDSENEVGEIKIKGFKEPKSARVLQIIESDLNDLKAGILQDDTMLKAMPGNIDAEVINKVLIPKIIREKYPDLSPVEIEELRQQVVVDSVIKNSKIEDNGDRKFVRMADSFVNIGDLNIDLIDTINPFQKAFEILSKSITTQALKVVQDTIASTRIEVTEQEALIMWPKIKEFVVAHDNKEPDINSFDPLQKRMAEVLIYLKYQKRKVAQNDA